MKKKGRGSPKKRKQVKKFEDHCPFWLFTLFVVAWSGVFFLVVALFYVALLKPAYRFIPLSTSVAPTRPQVDRGIEMMDEMIDEGMVEKASPLQSCRPLDDTDIEASAIENWLGQDRVSRQLGDRCVMDDGRVLVTFTYNDIIPLSERPYLRHGVGVVTNGSLQANVFYCRTSPRGEPATISATNGQIELQCAFQTGDDRVDRMIVLGDDLSIDAAATLQHSGNTVGYRLDTGDYAREYCVYAYANELPSVISDVAMDEYKESLINVCRFRNGDWIVAMPETGTVRIGADGSIVRAESINSELGVSRLTVIGSEGQYIDILALSAYDCGVYRLFRMNTRTGDMEQLFESTYCPNFPGD